MVLLYEKRAFNASVSADVEVQVRQQVVIAAVTLDQGFVADVGTHDLEVVVVLPEQRRGHQQVVSRADIGFFVAEPDHQVAGHGAELELERHLRVQRLRVFRHGAVGVQARVVAQLTIGRRALGPVVGIQAAVETPLSQRIRIALPAAGGGTDRTEVVERTGEAERRQQRHHARARCRCHQRPSHRRPCSHRRSAGASPWRASRSRSPACCRRSSGTCRRSASA